MPDVYQPRGMLELMIWRGPLTAGPFVALLAGLVACSTPQAPVPPAPVAAQAETQGVPVGALNPEVRQATIQQTIWICVPGCAASVKPSTRHTNGVKAKLFREQSLRASPPPASAPRQTGHQESAR